VDAPDEGAVWFDGRDLASGRDGLLGSEIGYANGHFMPTQGRTVVDQVAVGLLAHNAPIERARTRAYGALERVDAKGCAELDPRLLDPGEVTRVGIARAIVAAPRLLLIDDPINGVDLLQRDPLLDLIRSLADEGTAVLMTSGDVVTIADRMLSIDSGELRGEVVPEQAAVVPLRPARAEPSA
jgi:ABC-type ATPase involved in cell division